MAHTDSFTPAVAHTRFLSFPPVLTSTMFWIHREPDHIQRPQRFERFVQQVIFHEPTVREESVLGGHLARRSGQRLNQLIFDCCRRESTLISPLQYLFGYVDCWYAVGSRVGRTSSCQMRRCGQSRGGGLMRTCDCMANEWVGIPMGRQ